MARRAKTSLADIEQQIEALQRQAAELRASEVAGVIDRIEVAIQHYGLTAEQLGLAGTKRGPGPRTVRAAPTVAAPKQERAKKPPSMAKYSDGQGKTWTGNGKRPNWFKDAIAAGKTPEDLLVQP